VYKLRWLLIFGFVAWASLRCEAAKRLTVAQLEQVLSEAAAAHRPDSEIAARMAGISLVERIPQSSLARLSAQFRSNPQTSLALALIADQSEFLDLPVTESVADADPNGPEQVRMLQMARAYVSNTLRGLPNFMATRIINLFDDRAQPPKPGDWPTRSGLHLVGTSRAEISVMRERDDQPQDQSSAVWQSKIGLASGGEFGTTLGMIVADTATGTLRWGHWERGSTGVLAVFRYSVAASTSHFEIISSFQREASVQGVRSAGDGRGVSGIELRPNINSSNIEIVRSRPAYHGAIWLDPSTGTVYRVTMEVDMNKGLPFRRAAILVEYGAVEIAGANFICPLRSLAISEAQANAETISGTASTLWLNETRFTDYHRFGSSSRIVTEVASGGKPSSTIAAPTVTSNSTETPPREAAETATPIQTPDQSTSASERTKAAAGAQPLLPPPEESRPKAPGADTPEAGPSPATTLTAPTKTADVPTSPPPEVIHDSGFALRMDVNSLLVPAVVLDKDGKSVGGLAKEDFILLDNGKRRTITGFTLIKHTQDAERGTRESQTATPGAPADAPKSAAKKKRFLIFLFDDRHMTTEELPIVKMAATRLLERPLPDTDSAGVLSFMGFNSGITHDHTGLQASIAKLSLHHALQHDREDCPDVDYYSADQIIHQHNAIEFQIAVQKARQCSFIQVELSHEDPYNGMNNPNDPFQRAAMAAAMRAVAMGEEDARESFATLKSVVQAMSKLPGERVLILVSNGFLELSPETMKLKSEIMDLAAASDVVMNTLDARGLYVGNLDASHGGTTSTIANVTAEPIQNHLASMQANENVLSELAMGTGGRFFHNNNDLPGGLAMLVDVPESSYLLEISLKDEKATGAFHRLQVKVDKPGLEVHARNGYIAPKPASGKDGVAAGSQKR
jgi:VWFA-related protein